MPRSVLMALLLLAGCDDNGRTACKSAVKATLQHETRAYIDSIKPDNGESGVLFGYMFSIEQHHNDLKSTREIYCVYNKNTQKAALDFPKQ